MILGSELHEGIAHATVAPWRIAMDINELCNIRCSYCHIDALYGKEGKFSRTLPVDLAKALLTDADGLRVFEVTITGGEPTLAPAFEAIVEHAGGLEFTSTQVVTNGTRLTPAASRRLAKSGLTRVSISIDGPKAGHDQARGAGTWERAWRGLNNALDAGLTVNVISVIGTHNIDSWHHLTMKLKDAGVRSQNASLMCRLGRAESAESWQGVPEHRLAEVLLNADEVAAQSNDGSFLFHLNDGVLRSAGWTGRPTPLHAFQDQNPGLELVAKVDGSLVRNRIFGGNQIIGNINESSLASVWDGELASRSSGNIGMDAWPPRDLPEQYYNYSPGVLRDLAPRATALAPIGSRLRTRVEPWGSAVFDTETFSIVELKQVASIS